MPDAISKISATSYVRFRTCPRLYYWESVLGFSRAREEGARRFGTIYHKGLEGWWRFMSSRTPWDDADEALVVALKEIADNARHVDTNPFDVVAAEAMMVGYHSIYFEMEFSSPIDDGGVEIGFEVPLLDENGEVVDGWTMVGRKDAMMQFADRKKRVVEHKHTRSEITLGSDYWARLAVDTQSSMYIIAARALGHDVREVLYDVSRRPGIEPGLATPVEKRKLTKGKGCTTCGGVKSSTKTRKITKGTGIVMVDVTEAGKTEARASTCPDCEGSGWFEAPRLNANQREVDEPVDQYKGRVADAIVDDPNAFYRQGNVPRNEDSLRECAADLTVTTGEIATLRRWSDATGPIESLEARRKWPRNTQACTNIYGRRCDFLDVCAGATDPWSSPLYTIRRSRDELQQVAP